MWYDGIKRVVFIHVTGQLKILCLRYMTFGALRLEYFLCSKICNQEFVVSRLPVPAL